MKFFKNTLNNIDILNTDSFISENEKNNLVNKIINYKETNSSLFNLSLINDLELFTNKFLGKETLFNLINNTYTKFGEIYLQNIIKYPSNNIYF